MKNFLENRFESLVPWWVSGGLVGSLSERDLDRIRTNRSEHHVSLAENSIAFSSLQILYFHNIQVIGTPSGKMHSHYILAKF